ncbi:MAG: Stf0 family sulfotransferase [Desulfobacterales bacterium]|jgi:LPS sulfotransferase NodH
MHYNNTEKYDFPEIDTVLKSYVICSVPRSGSTLLCRGLWDSGIAGAPKEYFNNKHMGDLYSRWHPKNTHEYIGLLKKFRTSPNGIFGFKAHYDQFCRIYNELNIRSVFPNLRYIFVLRKDHVKQAISLSKAMQTNQWTSDDKVERIPEYDYHDIKQQLQYIKNQEEAWKIFFIRENIHPLRIIYEEFIENYEKTISTVFNHLTVQIPPTFIIATPKLKKIADTTNHFWFERFKNDQAIQKYNLTRIFSSRNIRLAILKSTFNRRKI